MSVNIRPLRRAARSSAAYAVSPSARSRRGRGRSRSSGRATPDRSRSTDEGRRHDPRRLRRRLEPSGVRGPRTSTSLVAARSAWRYAGRCQRSERAIRPAPSARSSSTSDATERRRSGRPRDGQNADGACRRRAPRADPRRGSSPRGRCVPRRLDLDARVAAPEVMAAAERPDPAVDASRRIGAHESRRTSSSPKIAASLLAPERAPGAGRETAAISRGRRASALGRIACPSMARSSDGGDEVLEDIGDRLEEAGHVEERSRRSADARASGSPTSSVATSSVGGAPSASRAAAGGAGAQVVDARAGRPGDRLELHDGRDRPARAAAARRSAVSARGPRRSRRVDLGLVGHIVASSGRLDVARQGGDVGGHVVDRRRSATRSPGKTSPTPRTCSTASSGSRVFADAAHRAGCPSRPGTATEARVIAAAAVARQVASRATSPSVGTSLSSCGLMPEIDDSIGLAHQGLDVGVGRAADDLDPRAVDASDRFAEPRSTSPR